MTRASTPTPSRWSAERVLWTWRKAVEHRGWETEVGGDSPWGWQVTPLEIADRDGGDVLLRASGFELYGTHKGIRRDRTLAYVGGLTEGGRPWVRRVPGTIMTVADALAWLVPAEAARREHVRVGSTYMVRMERASATTPSGTYRARTWSGEKQAFVTPGLGHIVTQAPRSWPGVKLVAQKVPA